MALCFYDPRGKEKKKDKKGLFSWSVLSPSRVVINVGIFQYGLRWYKMILHIFQLRSCLYAESNYCQYVGRRSLACGQWLGPSAN